MLPTIDGNIAVKYDVVEFKSKLIESYQVIYSDETLKEIKRSGDGYESFLNVLSDLNAYYLKIRVDSDFTPRGDATITDRNPFEAYKDYCDNIEPVYELMQEATLGSLSKFYGGNKGKSFEDINGQQSESFAGLLSYISDHSKVLKDAFPHLDIGINHMLESMQSQYDEALGQSSSVLKEHIENDKEWSGVKDYRDSTGIGPIQLNNIEPPNVIKKIWKHFENHESYKGFSIEQFLGISKSPIYRNREMHLHEKVTSAYNVLNVVGYFPDSKMKEQRRFTAAMSDAGHASMASFCSFLLSRDGAFLKKTKAVYEYLGASTQVVTVEFNANDV